MIFLEEGIRERDGEPVEQLESSKDHGEAGEQYEPSRDHGESEAERSDAVYQEKVSVPEIEVAEEPIEVTIKQHLENIQRGKLHFYNKICVYGDLAFNLWKIIFLRKEPG